MKQIYAIVLGIISFIGLLPGCVDDPEMDTRLQNAKAPEVSETTLEGEIGASSITLTAQIMQENGLPVTECGVCWSVQEQTQPIDNMRSSRFVKADRIEGHTFAATMSNLEDSTRYYVYAYAINDVDTAFSETEKVYTTIEGIGEVVTLAIDSTGVNATSALVKGEIKNRGVGITEMGFYYQKKENETGVPELSEQDSIVRFSGDLATIDTFSCRLTDLEPETWYYVRAFAKNQFGEFAFNVDSFRTTDGKPMVGNLRLIADSTTFTTADLSAYLLQAGDAEVSAYGFCWSEEETPVIGEADSIVCSSRDDNGRFVGRIDSLKPAKEYFARAYAINKFGISYSAEQVTIVTKSDEPYIITFAIPTDSIMDDGTVHVGGVLRNGGRGNATEWGICWSSTQQEPTIQNSERIPMNPDTVFTYVFENLKGATTYYVRAYAINEAGIEGYGTIQTFTTPAIFTTRNLYEGSSREYSAGFSIENQIYIAGGDLGNTRSQEMFSYSETDGWKPMANMSYGLSQMTAAVWNGKAYLLGGIDDNQVSGKSQVYDVSPINSWSELPDLTDGRFGAVSFVYRDSLYLLSGSARGGSGGGQYENRKELFRYDLTENTTDWAVYPTDFPAQRGGVAFVVNDQVYAGLGDDGSGKCNGFYLSSDSLTHWEPLSTLPANMGPVSSGVYNELRNSFFVVDEGGHIWEYSLQENQWEERSAINWNCRNYLLFNLNGEMYLLGQDLNSANNRFMMYNPVWDD